MYDASQVSVIIPTMPGREENLKRLISTLPARAEIIVLDDRDLLLAAKRNKGARKATKRFLLFIDDDNYLQPNAVNELIKGVNGAAIMGMVACYQDAKTIVADGGSLRNYVTGFTRGLYTNASLYSIPDIPYDVDEVANAFMMRRRFWKMLGGFDEKHFPIDLDEADFCKRAKNLGFKVMMNPKAICYHASQTYSRIPDFRRPMNAYFMGRNRILYQWKHLGKKERFIFFLFFFPVFYLSYIACLLYRRKPWMAWHFTKGVFDGLFRRLKNPFQ